MKNKGFTLIELLAVIVILAIIALIATPIILNIINDARKSSNERSAELYIDAVEQTKVAENMKRPEGFNPRSCIIQSNGNLKCDGEDTTVEVSMNGTKPSSGTLTIATGRISQGTTLNYNGFTATVDSNGKVSISDSSGSNTPTFYTPQYYASFTQSSSFKL